MLISGSLPDCPLVSSLPVSGILPASEIQTTGSAYLAGQSPAIQRVRAQLQRIAPHFRIALITGETGTGKETVARFLHARSAGASGPFIAWQAADFAGELNDDRNSTLLEKVQGGTLFLEYILEVAHAHQPLLLRLLQQVATRRQDVRIIAATRQELRPLVATGQFREDLYQRLTAVEIALPPLRKRAEDIATTAEILLRRIGITAIAADAIAHLERHTWPQNVRELRQALERAAAIAEGQVIEARHLSTPENSPASISPLRPMERLDDVIKRYVLEVLTRCSGNKLRAAEVLGISRSTLYRMLDATAARQELLARSTELSSR